MWWGFLVVGVRGCAHQGRRCMGQRSRQGLGMMGIRWLGIGGGSRALRPDQHCLFHLLSTIRNSLKIIGPIAHVGSATVTKSAPGSYTENLKLMVLSFMSCNLGTPERLSYLKPLLQYQIQESQVGHDPLHPG